MGNLGTTVLGGLVLVFFIYLCLPQRQQNSGSSTGEGQSSRNERKARARQISGATGLLGGTVEVHLCLSMHSIELMGMLQMQAFEAWPRLLQCNNKCDHRNRIHVGKCLQLLFEVVYGIGVQS